MSSKWFGNDSLRLVNSSHHFKVHLYIAVLKINTAHKWYPYELWGDKQL